MIQEMFDSADEFVFDPAKKLNPVDCASIDLIPFRAPDVLNYCIAQIEEDFGWSDRFATWGEFVITCDPCGIPDHIIFEVSPIPQKGQTRSVDFIKLNYRTYQNLTSQNDRFSYIVQLNKLVRATTERLSNKDSVHLRDRAGKLLLNFNTMERLLKQMREPLPKRSWWDIWWNG